MNAAIKSCLSTLAENLTRSLVVLLVILIVINNRSEKE